MGCSILILTSSRLFYFTLGSLNLSPGRWQCELSRFWPRRLWYRGWAHLGCAKARLVPRMLLTSGRSLRPRWEITGNDWNSLNTPSYSKMFEYFEMSLTWTDAKFRVEANNFLTKRSKAMKMLRWCQFVIVLEFCLTVSTRFCKASAAKVLVTHYMVYMARPNLGENSKTQDFAFE